MESESLAYHCSVLQVFSCYLAVKYRGIVLNNSSGCYFYATDILGRVGCDNVGDLAHWFGFLRSSIDLKRLVVDNNEPTVPHEDQSCI